MHDLNIRIVNERNPTSRKCKEVETVSLRRTRRIAISENNNSMSIKINDIYCKSEKCYSQVKIIDSRMCLVFLKTTNDIEIIMT